MGHTRDKCWDLHGRPSSTANVAHLEVEEPHTTVASPQQQNPATFTLSEAEYMQYLQFQASQQASHSSTASLAHATTSTANLSHLSSGSGKWIMDSGASDHMSGNSSLLSDIRPCHNSVALADGSSASVTGIGSATLSPSLTLSSVLHLPTFPCNLLSIRKLTKTFNCSVTFTSTSVIVQDLQTGVKIGTGHE